MNLEAKKIEIIKQRDEALIVYDQAIKLSKDKLAAEEFGKILAYNKVLNLFRDDGGNDYGFDSSVFSVEGEKC